MINRYQLANNAPNNSKLNKIKNSKFKIQKKYIYIQNEPSRAEPRSLKRK